jgi:hypothetical protein
VAKSRKGKIEETIIDNTFSSNQPREVRIVHSGKESREQTTEQKPLNE